MLISLISYFWSQCRKAASHSFLRIHQDWMDLHCAGNHLMKTLQCQGSLQAISNYPFKWYHKSTASDLLTFYLFSCLFVSFVALLPVLFFFLLGLCQPFFLRPPPNLIQTLSLNEQFRQLFKLLCGQSRKYGVNRIRIKYYLPPFTFPFYLL